MQVFQGRNVRFRRLDGGSVRIDYVTSMGAPVGGETLESDDFQRMVVAMSKGGPDEGTEAIVRHMHDGPVNVMSDVGDTVDLEGEGGPGEAGQNTGVEEEVSND